MASRGKVGHFLKSTEINDLQNRIQFKISAYMGDEEGLSYISQRFTAQTRILAMYQQMD